MTPPTAIRNLEPPAGMQREVGLLFTLLEEARRRTRELVLGLGARELEARAPGGPHTIGALLLHLAAAERFWMHRIATNEAVAPSAREEFAALDLDALRAHPPTGHEPAWYLGTLDEARARTEAVCWRLKDESLDEPRDRVRAPERVTVRWILAQLLDHEAHHRGQIALLLHQLRGGAGT